MGSTKARWAAPLVVLLLLTGCERLAAFLAELDRRTSTEPTVSEPTVSGPNVVAEPSPAGSADDNDFDALFRSPAECLSSRLRSSSASAARLRLLSWNVRWFPRGSLDHDHSPTNIDWLACIISRLSPSAIGLQEILLDGDARDALTRLIHNIQSLGGPRYQIFTDRCARDAGRQHLAALVHENFAAEAHDVAALNPTGNACGGRLRPGLLVSMTVPHGSVHFTTLHLDSGTTDRDHDRRRASFEALADVHRGMGLRNAVFMGDFNTMGCDRCPQPATADDELEALTQFAREASLELLIADRATTLGSFSSRLDHVLISRSLNAASASTVRVLGPCGRSQNRRFQDEISDHCPVMLELGLPAPD